MPITTVSSREFNQDKSLAKKASAKGPVFVTDRGEPSYVFMTIAEYRRITNAEKSIADLLAMPGGEDIDFDLPSRHELVREVDLS